MSREDRRNDASLSREEGPPEGAFPTRPLTSPGTAYPARCRQTTWRDERALLAPDRPRLQVGAEPVPGYRLVGWIGTGGSGEVWRASGPGGFPLAMKFIPLATEDAATELEALELLRGIRHPNLITVFRAWQVNGLLAIAMELAEGNLWDRYHEAVAQGWPGIPQPELIEYLRGAAKALDYLNAPRHDRRGRKAAGVQHRDIKPHNLVLVGGRVKVADFGLARWVGHTSTDTVHLTPAYAGPECFHGQTSGRSDQYALAVTYCQLRSGRLPFTGSVWQIMLGHSQDDPDLEMLSAAERQVIARALAKRPEDRWPDCRTLVEELAQRGRSRSGPPGVGSSGRAGKGTGRRYHLLRWVVAASLLVLVTAPEAGLDCQPPLPGAAAPTGTARNEVEEHPREVLAANVAEVAPAVPEGPDAPAEIAVAETARVPETPPPEELARAHNVRGEAFLAAKHYDQAVVEFTEAIRLSPGWARPYSNRGSAHAARNDFDQALADYVEALRLDPADASSYRQRGHVYAARGDYDAAFANYARALPLDPADVEAHHGEGLAWYFKGAYDRAVACFTAALRIAPASAPVRNSRALAYTARGDLDRAVADFSAALQSDPRYAEALNNRGVVLARRGDLTRALADFRAALRIDPRNSVYERNRTRVAAQLPR